ncbi:DUF29 domain-containing protein [Aureimonas leprariae]|uniref:DUF29 domain-containing protein n=1 Tax=Plantimonas leprariae TaxID=2615207 RepID=A0A7V7PSP6_9HYPH|nr:DUF29 domain-containing protein [Aureimonas leprariae]KAB0682614.1 DUF29 domain-containing protein [Aureimonas leprariae]
MSLAKGKPYFSDPADYEDDVHAWAYEQAQLLRLARFSEVDLPNVIEEIESLGREQRHALKSSYRVLISHLLKWQHQPQRRSRSWLLTIGRERDKIEDREEDNRSLRREAQELVDGVYSKAVREAARETKLPRDAFPALCPYTVEQLRDQEFFPR